MKTRVRRVRRDGKREVDLRPAGEAVTSVDAVVAMIQGLIPLGLEKFEEERGAVYTADQKMPVRLPELRGAGGARAGGVRTAGSRVSRPFTWASARKLSQLLERVARGGCRQGSPDRAS
jgi:hypothetical protein